MPVGIVEECAMSFRCRAIAVAAGGKMPAGCAGDGADGSLLRQPR